MAVTHGINTSKKATSVSVPVTVASGVHFVVGTAPVQMVGGKANEVVMLRRYSCWGILTTGRNTASAWKCIPHSCCIRSPLSLW